MRMFDRFGFSELIEIRKKLGSNRRFILALFLKILVIYIMFYLELLK